MKDPSAFSFTYISLALSLGKELSTVVLEVCVYVGTSL